MKILRTRAEAYSQMEVLVKEGRSIGFVPTMGALHQGHAILIKRSNQENDFTVCSIFVNPLQFNNKEDLDKYPSTLDYDIELLEKNGCHFLFTPAAEEFYKNVAPKRYDFGNLDRSMEATYRPGHFEGVATVVRELFNALLPTKAYFGEKDYQQLAIVRWLVKEEKSVVKIIPCSTVRDKRGLALSSRNQRLSNEALEIAPLIYQTMDFCKENKSLFNPEELLERANLKLNHNFEIDYLEIVNELNLEKLNKWEEGVNARVFVAAYLEGVRLIDNLSLNY